MRVVARVAIMILLGAAGCLAQTGESAHARNEPKLEKMPERRGNQQADARTGISYMIAPVMRSYSARSATEVATFSMPHYAF